MDEEVSSLWYKEYILKSMILSIVIHLKKWISVKSDRVASAPTTIKNFIAPTSSVLLNSEHNITFY